MHGHYEHAAAAGRSTRAPLITAMALRDMGAPQERLREACSKLAMSRGRGRLSASFDAALAGELPLRQEAVVGGPEADRGAHS